MLDCFARLRLPAACRRWRVWLGAALLAVALPAAARDWADEVLYFVLVDRFADGDRGNDAGVQRANPGGWHGGDLAGLSAHLDELQDLGVTAIWVNPLQLQQPRGVPAQASGVAPFIHEGFHGYWIADFEKLDPHFGSEGDLKQFVEQAHRRGMRVLLDVVYNHTGYTSTYAARRTADGQGWIRVGEGNCEVDPVTCAVGGLPDLRTELPEVRDYLLAADIGLAKRSGVDGFRLDTYKHVGSDFWAEHRRRTRAELGAGFFLLAEYWGGTAQSLDPFFARDEIDAGIDFSFSGSCEAWVGGRGRSVAYAAYLRSRHATRPGHLLAHYLSSHDEPMALGVLEGDRERFRVCAALQMTSVGIPIIYYGEEVARGGRDWPLNRNDMPWGERDILPGKGIARDEAMRAFYKQIVRIRREHPALPRGDFQMLTQGPDTVLAFARSDAASGDRVVVLANRDAQAAAADVAAPPGWPAAARDLLSGERVPAIDGRIKATLAPKSVRILVPEDR